MELEIINGKTIEEINLMFEEASREAAEQYHQEQLEMMQMEEDEYYNSLAEAYGY